MCDFGYGSFKIDTSIETNKDRASSACAGTRYNFANLVESIRNEPAVSEHKCCHQIGRFEIGEFNAGGVDGYPDAGRRASKAWMYRAEVAVRLGKLATGCPARSFERFPGGLVATCTGKETGPTPTKSALPPTLWSVLFVHVLDRARRQTERAQYGSALWVCVYLAAALSKCVN